MYVHTVEYQSVIKNEALAPAGKWMDPEVIMLSETSQTHEGKPLTSSAPRGT